MNIDKYFERIERIDRLIRLKATGSPKEFAKKLGISESSLYEYLRYLKDKGGPIEFDKEDIEPEPKELLYDEFNTF